MRASSLLAWRELNGRRGSFVAALVLVAVVAALLVTFEFLSRGREAAVGGQIDLSGPGLRALAAATDESMPDSTRGPIDRMPRALADRIRREAADFVRGADLWLRIPAQVLGAPVVLIGLEPGRVVSPFASLRGLQPETVVLGDEAARRLRRQAGDELEFQGQRFRVAAVLPSTASAEDLGLFLRLEALQRVTGLEDAVSEIRFFPRSPEHAAALASRLAQDHPGLTLLHSRRDTQTEEELAQTLASSRRAVYLFCALIVAACLAISTYLNATERRVEMATLVALGATKWTVLGVLVLRSAIIGFLGAAAGFVLGVGASLLQGAEAGLDPAFAGELLLLTLTGASAVCALAAVAAAARIALQNPVIELQKQGT